MLTIMGIISLCKERHQRKRTERKKPNVDVEKRGGN
jgi:hypothetical protein